MGWRSRKSWSDRFVPEIKSILGTVLIDVAETGDDALRNTDLITLTMRSGLRIACRVRRHPYLAAHGDEFTIRCSVVSGRETEIDKVLAGWGDYLFYGFANAAETALAAWFVGDLKVFREWFASYRRTFQDWPGEIRRNHDGGSKFLVFGIYDVDRRFILARKEPRLPALVQVRSRPEEAA
jgi:hypothetical protein